MNTKDDEKTTQSQDQEPIRLVHCVGPVGDGPCPKCGSEEVSEHGSGMWGPFYWQCDECGEEWGHA